jgi:endoglucanase
VIGADLVSEPYASSWGDGNLETDIAAAYTRCANAIHAVNPDWLIFCEGIYETLNFGPANGGWVGIGWAAGLTLAGRCPVQPTLPNRVVYSPHDYGPGVCNFNYFNVPRFPNNMPAVWNQMFGYLVKNNIAPVWFGEIGDMLVSGANWGAENPQRYQHAVQWITMLMSYVTGGTMTGGTPDVPPGSAGFSWSWFCWSTNGYSGVPGSIVNTDLLMNDFNTVNSTVMQYLTPHLAPLMLAPIPIAVTLVLSAPAGAGATVQWATADGTALAGTHYTAAAGTATIPAGATSTVITVAALAVSRPQGGPQTRYFWIELGNPVNCTIGTPQAKLTIGYV